ncbi:YiaA/YiaB family inner membrane protein [Okeania sp. SIO2F4]|uniref:YiaA/YiaB family inner membrane protein n=1 Tax=Microcoleaceae TaxID=1892252 RepID=UPI003429A04D
MTNKYVQQKDTAAWILQVWASFILATVGTATGIIYLPVDNWIKSFVGMGLIFSIGSAFTLAKTIRDNYESKSLKE